MDKTLEKILALMSLQEQSLKEISSSTIDKVIVNSSTYEITIYLTLEHYLTFSTFDDLMNNKNKIDKTAKAINFSFIVNDNDFSPLLAYFPYVLDLLKDKIMFKSNYFDGMKLGPDGLFIEIVNKDLIEELERIIKDINILYKSFGYQKDITYVFNENAYASIQNDISLELASHYNQVQEKNKTNETSIIIEESKNTNPSSYKKDNAYRIPKNITEEGSVLGRIIEPQTIRPLKNLVVEEPVVVVEAYIFGIEGFESAKSSFKIITLKLTDETDSICCKIFSKDKTEYSQLMKELKVGTWLRIRGNLKDDVYAKELVLNAKDINKFDKPKEVIKDTSEQKRVELHAHTIMSQMDGVVDAKTLVKQAYKWGHRAIAITDHNGAQAFPDIYHTVCDINKKLKEGEEPFKAIYGTELTLIEDSINIVTNETKDNLLDTTYVVFDFETTGFNAGGGDTIIEIGAVKLKNGEIIEKYDELINPGRHIPSKITEITNITDEMVKDCGNEEDAIKKSLKGDTLARNLLIEHNLRLVAHIVKKFEQKNMSQDDL
ncbi:MAG: PHP domain-containing protein, partial [Bacilli bacterium]